MFSKPIQEYFPKEATYCYGCGCNNTHGLQIKTLWDGEEGLCRFFPQSHHMAFPGFVYGGLTACLMDCHSICTAVASAYEEEKREPGTNPTIMFVTGNLNISYLHPTPMDTELILRARVISADEKKSTVNCSLYADEKKCSFAEVTAVRVDWLDD